MLPPCPPPELVEEVALRLPPDNPASLTRASLVCKPWRRLLSNPTFLSRYRAFHGTPPLFGFLHNQYCSDGGSLPQFIPTISPLPLVSFPPPANAPCCWALDCRHGRVLIYNVEPSILIVWDPITGDQQKHVPLPDYPYDSYSAAVLCAMDRCNHLECSGGSFKLVFKGNDYEADGMIWVSVYSSENSMWSVPISVHIDPVLDPPEFMESCLLLGDAVYFTHDDGQRVLTYDMGQHVVSVISLPALFPGNMVLVTSEDGNLGIATVEGYNLRLWWHLDPNGDVANWVPGRVIELDMMRSIDICDSSSSLHVVGYAERAHAVFISAHAGIFIVETKSGQVRKVDATRDLRAIFPYDRFYNPDHAHARLQEPINEDRLIGPISSASYC